MPRVIIKLQSCRSEQRKTTMVEEVIKGIASCAHCAKQSVSVIIDDVEPSDWVEEVYKPGIIVRPDTLYMKLGDDPL